MKILISQKQPSNTAAYQILEEKFGVSFTFSPLFLIEPLSLKEFRARRINLPDYTAVVFSSRHAIDAYFKLCEESRFKVPETMKYFCSTELVAIYLQKHVVYRKRKIFFGDGTPASVVSLIGPKHKGEKFLIATSAESKREDLTTLFDNAKLDYTVGELVKPVLQDVSALQLSDYRAVVLYNPYDLKALGAQISDFRTCGLDFIAYGKGIAAALQEAGADIAVQGPAPDITSVAKALQLYLEKRA
ncbi:MAG: uroporphyrinogen-III synthase [Bacteroidales bacterium]|nr:uroporphyrinogen-III synthase [Bacteroidales bacterium]